MSRTWHKKKEENYRGSKAFDSHCRNNGSCGYCLGNRTHKHKRQMKYDKEEWIDEIYEAEEEACSETKGSTDTRWGDVD